MPPTTNTPARPRVSRSAILAYACMVGGLLGGALALPAALFTANPAPALLSALALQLTLTVSHVYSLVMARVTRTPFWRVFAQTWAALGFLALLIIPVGVANYFFGGL